MAHARLTYFSGTGNTRWAVDRLAQGLRSAGFQIDEAEIGKDAAAARAPRESRRSRRQAPAHDVELDVFLFPVYAFALPHLVRRHLAGLLRAPHKPAAIVAVFGNSYVGRKGRRRAVPGYQGGSLVEARKLLERRGYVVFASSTVGLPVSFTQFSPAPPSGEQALIAEKAAASLSGLARRLAKEEGGHLPFPRANWLWLAPVRAAFRLLGRRLLGKLYAADASCTGCGTCARMCPVANIRMRRGRPRWGWRCEACQRCINGCPEAAIQASTARALLVTAATVLPYNRVFHLDSLWGRVGFLGEWGSRGFWTGSFLVCSVVALIAVDLLLASAERAPALRRVLAWGHTRLWGRYQGPAGSTRRGHPS